MGRRLNSLPPLFHPFRKWRNYRARLGVPCVSVAVRLSDQRMTQGTAVKRKPLRVVLRGLAQYPRTGQEEKCCDTEPPPCRGHQGGDKHQQPEQAVNRGELP